MANGLTNELMAGRELTLKEFAVRVAKSENMLRTDLAVPRGVIAGEFTGWEPGHYGVNVELAKAKFTKISTMTQADKEAAAEAHNKKLLEWRKEPEKRLQYKKELRARYDGMIDKINNWKPAIDSEAFRNFRGRLLNEINVAIAWDCQGIDQALKTDPNDWQPVTAEEFWNQELADAGQELATANARLDEAYKAVTDRNDLVQLLVTELNKETL